LGDIWFNVKPTPPTHALRSAAEFAILQHHTIRGCDMNTRWALGIILLILGIFALDHFYLEWNLPVVLGTLLVRILDWMAFWR
jgi:hypothetical protein